MLVSFMQMGEIRGYYKMEYSLSYCGDGTCDQMANEDAASCAEDCTYDECSGAMALGQYLMKGTPPTRGGLTLLAGTTVSVQNFGMCGSVNPDAWFYYIPPANCSLMISALSPIL